MKDDTISRQAAIDALWEIRQEEISDGRRFHDYCSLSTAVDVIKDLPPVQPQRKTGKWIQFPNHMAYKCSECGRVIQTTDGRRNVSKHYPFCHCGAKMEADNDDIPIEYFESGGK